MTQTLPILDCKGCGACCMEVSCPPSYSAYFSGLKDEILTPDEIQRIESLPGDSLQELREYFERVRRGEICDGEKPCIWLDQETMTCKHYEHRPDICRDFEPGSQYCLQWRMEYGVDD